MLSIGKLGAAQASYYTEQLTHSVGEDRPVLDRRLDGPLRSTTTPLTNPPPAGWAPASTDSDSLPVPRWRRRRSRT